MKKLAAYAFLCASLIRPNGVLCIEPSGEVRVEFGGTVCCVGEASSEYAALADEPADGCTDCRDIALSAHSLSAHRLHLDAPAISGAMPLGVNARDINAVAHVHAAPIDHGHRHHQLLATTIIRR